MVKSQTILYLLGMKFTDLYSKRPDSFVKNKTKTVFADNLVNLLCSEI